MTTLYTFAMSHFCEKVRWALDRARLPYEERLLSPGPHMLQVRLMAPRSSVPLLRDHGRIVQGSSAILDYLGNERGVTDYRLDGASAERIRDWEQRLDNGFGLSFQQLFCASATGVDAHIVKKLWGHGGPLWAKALYGVAVGPLNRIARRTYRAHLPGSFEAAAERFDRTLDSVAERLDGRRFFFGAAPGRVDITSAALLGPLLRPDNHPLPSPGLPDRLARFVAERAAHPAFSHAWHMYEAHRYAAAPYRLGHLGRHEPVT
ncbi:MAG: glutathione S-transferase [Myxococcales bacterium]|nr:glutathione S-transferase [Myxococcales bacterium]MDD9970354.1 glutathione S-transferase [Myxococcales bacterium]